MVADQEKKYYLQDSRSIVGNFLLFWRKDHHGYTTDIQEAHEFTLKEALSHRRTDIPWEAEEMREKARLRVDHQKLRYYPSDQRERMVRRLAGLPEDKPTEPPEEIHE